MTLTLLPCHILTGTVSRNAVPTLPGLTHPDLDSIKVPYKTDLFEATFFGDSIYGQDASKEVHSAWQELGLLSVSICS
jgi:hypothetical protein